MTVDYILLLCSLFVHLGGCIIIPEVPGGRLLNSLVGYFNQCLISN